MTRRRPLAEPQETYVERLIREAMEKGAFDHLEGEGKPIPDIDEPVDEMWWWKKKFKREGLNLVPEALELAREIELVRERIRTLSEETARTELEELNEKIRRHLATVTSGPTTHLVPLDVEAELRLRKG